MKKLDCESAGRCLDTDRCGITDCTTGRALNPIVDARPMRHGCAAGKCMADSDRECGATACDLGPAADRAQIEYDAIAAIEQDAMDHGLRVYHEADEKEFLVTATVQIVVDATNPVEARIIAKDLINQMISMTPYESDSNVGVTIDEVINLQEEWNRG